MTMRVSSVVLGAQMDGLTHSQIAARVGGAIAAVLLGTVLSLTYAIDSRHRTPASAWLEITSVHVTDTKSGVDPLLLIERTIHSAFVGEWVVTVRRIEAGGLTVACEGSGQTNYSPDSRLPRPTPLRWWAGVECKLEPGSYRVDTSWRMYPPGYPMKTQHRSSNIFRVAD